MEPILNTLFVMTQGAYLRLDHDTVKVEVEKVVKIQVPLMHLSGIVLFGDVLISPFFMHKCAEEGRSVVFLGRGGRFKARLVGPTSGNILLRKAQYEMADDENRLTRICRNIVAGKAQNCRSVVMRSAREDASGENSQRLKNTASSLAATIRAIEETKGVHEIRGFEGIAAKSYFETFDLMIKANRESFIFANRSRRPPRDRINALLSFIYTLLASDCTAALEGVGLDPQMGYLHAIRPGRNALALDLMEEFRPIIADRLTLSLINMRQITPDDFEDRPGGAVYLNEKGRKTVLTEYQKKKQDEIQHSYLQRRAPLGVMPHLQARLLARHIRGDMDEYIPFVPR